MNSEKDKSKCWPINMFCGLPMMVAIEPPLVPQASARRNGTGLRPRLTQSPSSTGTKATATTSLVSKADITPETATTTAKKAREPIESLPMRSDRAE